MAKTCQDWARKSTSFSSGMERRSVNLVQNGEKTPEEWLRTTCNSKWVYKKAPKLDTD